MMNGEVISFQGTTVESRGPHCRIGDRLDVGGVPALVLGFRRKRIFSMLLGDPQGIGRGTTVQATGKPLAVPVGLELRGRVLDGLGRALDGEPAPVTTEEYPLHTAPAPFSARGRVERILPTGVRVVDSLLPLGAGQTMAMLADAGVGKATTLGIMARNTTASTVVLAHIGERATELRDFIERDLGQDGLARSVVVAAPADACPALRVQALYTAVTVAEYFRDQNQDVLLLVDSVPRWWAARTEIALPAAGLDSLMARCGPRARGSITTVLVTDLRPENDLRPFTEGHLTLTKRIAHTGCYPAVDVTQSVSRRFTEIATREHLNSAAWLRALLACHHENELLIESGAYKSGFNPRVDQVIARYPECRAFLMQAVYEEAGFDDTLQRLARLAEA